MLYIDGELLNTRNRNPEYTHSKLVKQYYETVSELREKFGDVLRIQTRQKMRIDSKTGFPRHPAAKGLLLQASVSTDDGISEWIYSPTTLKVVEGVPKMTEPNILVDKGEMFIDMKKNPDLAFYCVASRKVGRNEK